MKDLNEVYKNLVEGNKIAPPEEMWKSISKDLDIDDVWERVTEDLNYESSLTSYDRFSFAVTSAGLILLLLVELFYNPPEINKFQAISPEPGTEESSVEQRKDLNADNRDIDIKILTPWRNVITLNNSLSVVDLIPNPINIVMRDSNQDYGVSSLEIDYIHNLGLYPLQEVNFPILSLQYIPITHDEEVVKRTRNYKAYIGVTSSIRNVWLLNDLTFRGFDENELHSTVPDFDMAIGLVSGLTLSDRLATQGEMMIISNYGQKYRDYVNGKYVKRDLDLDYFQLNVILSYKLKLHNENKLSSSILLGPYWGLLKSASENIGKENIDIKANYKQSVFGVILGYEYLYSASPRLGLHSGLRFTYGISNIYSGNNLIPASFRKTHPGAVSFNLGIRYNVGVR